MKTIAYSLPGWYTSGVRYDALNVFHQWDVSPRDEATGALLLRANPWVLMVVKENSSHSNDGELAPDVYPNFLGTTNDPKILRAQEIARSDLRGTLARKIKARNVGALGVSIASSAQSIAMMRGITTRLSQLLVAGGHFYLTSKGRKRGQRLRRLVNRGAPLTAGMVLEGFFGWAPLIEDFSSALRTLSDPWPPSTAVSVSKRWEVDKAYVVDESGYLTRVNQWSATGRESYACRVEVSNPNLWVANKLGLVNPFAVAWDLVPWSFVVNMFSNMGQVMGSLTDFTGLSLLDGNMTTSVFMTENATTHYRDPRPLASSRAQGQRWTKVRSRVVGIDPPRAVPYLRFPEWGVGTAAILGSLLVQNCGRFQRSLDWAMASEREYFSPFQ